MNAQKEHDISKKWFNWLKKICVIVIQFQYILTTYSYFNLKNTLANNNAYIQQETIKINISSQSFLFLNRPRLIQLATTACLAS